MKCIACEHEVCRARVIDGLYFCVSCCPRREPDISGKLSGNSCNPKETEAYKRDLESRYVPPGQSQWERWSGAGRKVYI